MASTSSRPTYMPLFGQIRWLSFSLYQPLTCLNLCRGSPNTQFKLTDVTHSQMIKEMSISELPANYQDAVALTKAFSIRYLWIDSICMTSNPLPLCSCLI